MLHFIWDYVHALFHYWWVMLFVVLGSFNTVWKWFHRARTDLPIPHWVRILIAVGAVFLAQILAYRDSSRNLNRVVEEKRALVFENLQLKHDLDKSQSMAPKLHLQPRLPLSDVDPQPAKQGRKEENHPSTNAAVIPSSQGALAPAQAKVDDGDDNKPKPLLGEFPEFYVQAAIDEKRYPMISLAIAGSISAYSVHYERWLESGTAFSSQQGTTYFRGMKLRQGQCRYDTAEIKPQEIFTDKDLCPHEAIPQNAAKIVIELRFQATKNGAGARQRFSCSLADTRLGYAFAEYPCVPDR